MNPDDLFLNDVPEDVTPLEHYLNSYTGDQITEDVIETIPTATTNDDLDLTDIGLPLPPDSVIHQDDTPLGVEFYGDDELDRDSERIMRMAQVVGKFASTLALKPIKVDVTNEAYGDAPAWSDSETIYFQRKLIGDVTDPEVVTSIKGLSLHESAHIMLTPRDGSKLAKAVKSAGLWRGFNALEDQRIEMYMTTRFGNTDAWLTATIAQHIVAKPEQHSVAFPIIHGRKYLPAVLRAEVERLYEQPQHVAELRDLIDRYIVLNLGDTTKYDEAFAIIKRYSELVDLLEPVDPSTPWAKKGWARIDDPSGHDHRKEGEWKSSSNKPMNKAEQAATMSRVAQGINKGEGEENGNVSVSYELGDTDAKVDTDSAIASGGKGAGTGSAGTLQQIAQQEIDKVLRDKAQEIRNAVKQYSGEGSLDAKQLPPPKRANTESYWGKRMPRLEAVQAVKSFARELEQLRADYDPGWNRKVEQGKLNVQRYSTGVDLEECFDEWDMGREDAVDIEAVILLDNSWSMSADIDDAYESMWAIKRALDKINASTTVVTFSHTTELLYSSDQRAEKHVPPRSLGNSTDPYKSLRYARSVLANSKRAIKILIPITDGVWSDAKECNELIKHMRQGGVLTALGMIGAPERTQEDGTKKVVIDTHGCEVAVHIHKMSQLFLLARDMVKVGINRNLSR